VLQPAEFQRLLQLSGFSFSGNQIRDLVDAADTNRDGVIQYDEFIPVAMSLLSAQQDSIDTYIDTQEEGQARQYLLQGKTREQLERQLKKMFLFADTDCSGQLDLQEFKNALAQMGLPLSAAQITELMRMVDVDGNGLVSYEEFVPVAFEILVKVVTGKLEPAAPQQQQQQQQQRAAPQRAAARASSRGPATSRGPAPAPAQSADVASLEGRVLAVQSRRIIRSKIKDLFARLDTDKDGRLTVPELSVAFGDSLARRIHSTLDRNHDGRVTQYEMRRFFDDECSKAVESGVPEYKYLEGIVEMLEGAF